MLPKAFLDRERKRTNHTHKRRVRRKKPGTVFCVITIKSNILNPFPLPGTSQILLLHHIALLLSHSYAGESIRRWRLIIVTPLPRFEIPVCADPS